MRSVWIITIVILHGFSTYGEAVVRNRLKRVPESLSGSMTDAVGMMTGIRPQVEILRRTFHEETTLRSLS